MTASASILPFAPLPDCWPDDAETKKVPERSKSPRAFYSDDEPRPGDDLERSDPAGGPSFAFGPFRLYPRRRLLLENDKPIRLGSRAFDILTALVEHPGELVSKQDLIARVWPGIVIDDRNLKVNIASLRRALHDGELGNRYICTVPGRGYYFVVPVLRSGGALIDSPAERSHDPQHASTGRCSEPNLVSLLAEQVSRQRFVMVVGAGEVMRGLVLAAALTASHQREVVFVDLAALRDEARLAGMVAMAIGIEGGCSDPLTGITASLNNKSVLLVLDNCKEQIAAISDFAAAVLRYSSDVQILGISH